MKRDKPVGGQLYASPVSSSFAPKSPCFLSHTIDCHKKIIRIHKNAPMAKKRADLGKPSRKKSAVFFNIVQTGEGGVNPCSKIMSEIVVCSGGHLTT